MIADEVVKLLQREVVELGALAARDGELLDDLGDGVGGAVRSH